MTRQAERQEPQSGLVKVAREASQLQQVLHELQQLFFLLEDLRVVDERLEHVRSFTACGSPPRERRESIRGAFGWKGKKEREPILCGMSE